MNFEIFFQAKVLPETYDKDYILKILREEAPLLTVNSLTFIVRGWSSLVVDVNNEWILRFPRHASFLQFLARERELLNQLKSNVSLSTPFYELIGSNTAFVGYRKIPGIALSKQLYTNLSQNARQDIADTLAIFLSEMHKTITLKNAQLLGYKNTNLPIDLMESSLDKLPPNDLKRIVKEALIHFKAHPKLENLVLLHNDLHGENMAYDPVHLKLNGVFDFSDAAIGNYTIDFAKLFSVDSDLAKRSLKKYAYLNQVPDCIVDSAAHYILSRFSIILFSRLTGNFERVQSRLKMLKDFISTWDEINKLV